MNISRWLNFLEVCNKSCADHLKYLENGVIDIYSESNYAPNSVNKLAADIKPNCKMLHVLNFSYLMMFIYIFHIYTFVHIHVYVNVDRTW